MWRTQFIKILNLTRKLIFFGYNIITCGFF